MSASDSDGHHHHKHYSRDRRKRLDDDHDRNTRKFQRRDRRKRSHHSPSSSDSEDDHRRRKSSRKERPRSRSASTITSLAETRAPEPNLDRAIKRRHRLEHPLSPPSSSRPIGRHDDMDSDPLEDIVGPMPPPAPPKVHIRGRGAVSNSTGMDSRFASNYDPSTDVNLDMDEEDDWGQALEALQARAKFKSSQGDRLRAAGFSEDEIKSWERGGEKNEDDVRWSKLGEGREWDRGKVLDDDGKVKVDMDFGRLK